MNRVLFVLSLLLVFGSGSSRTAARAADVHIRQVSAIST
jgi:hypothetical protein